MSEAATHIVVIEVAAAAVMVLGVGGAVYNRIKLNKGIGVRVIQFAGVVILPPLILILALEGILQGSVVGALVGALVGFFFNELTKREKPES